MASQLAAGLAGIDQRVEPGPLELSPYDCDKPKLPRSLMEATTVLRDNPVYRAGLGDAFIDYILAIKQNEIDRFLQHVTDWEHREYFEVY